MTHINVNGQRAQPDTPQTAIFATADNLISMPQDAFYGLVDNIPGAFVIAGIGSPGVNDDDLYTSSMVFPCDTDASATTIELFFDAIPTQPFALRLEDINAGEVAATSLPTAFDRPKDRETLQEHIRTGRKICQSLVMFTEWSMFDFGNGNMQSWVLGTPFLKK